MMKFFSSRFNQFLGLWLFIPFLGAAAIFLGLIPQRGLSMMALTWFLGLSILIGIKTRRKELLIVFGSISALLAAELGFWIVPKVFQRSRNYDHQPKCSVFDPVLGSRFIPEIQTTSILHRGDALIYKVINSIDQAGRRSCMPVMPNADRHALFFGGSITFGDGVKDDETLPSRVQQLFGGKYAAYNYGKGGWGTGQMLTLLRSDRFADDIPYPKGFAVYVFIGDHIYRTTGKYRYVFHNPNYQIYSLDEDGRLKGPFRWDSDPRMRRWMNRIRFLEKSSPAINYFVRHDWFHPISDEKAVQITARVIHASKDDYKMRFDGEFYVLIWPRLKLSDNLEQYFIKKLKEININVIKVPPYPDKERARIHPLDEHPSIKEYMWVARHLVEGIKSTDANKKVPKQT